MTSPTVNSVTKAIDAAATTVTKARDAVSDKSRALADAQGTIGAPGTSVPEGR